MSPLVLFVSVFNRQPLYSWKRSPLPTREPPPVGVSDHARVGEDLGNGTYTTVSRLSDQGQSTAVPRSIRPTALTAISGETLPTIKKCSLTTLPLCEKCC